MKDKKVRKTLSIDPKLWEELQKFAESEGSNISKLVTEFSKSGMKKLKESKKSISERLAG